MVSSRLIWQWGRKAVISLLIFGAIQLTASMTAATVIEIPGDYPTIQEGIDAAVFYDTVLVAPGRYYENVNFRGNPIVLTSYFMFEHNTDYIFNTIIDGSQQSHPDTGSAVLLINGEGPEAKVQGFTITGGTGTLYEWSPGQFDRNGGGICMFGSSATVQYNYICGNDAIDDEGLYSAGGGGIRARGGDPSILNNIVVHNRGHYGAGIYLAYCSGIVKNNVVAYNTGGSKYSGSGIYVNAGTSILIENNTIVGNVSPLKGAGIKMITASPVMRNNIVWYNEGPLPHVSGYNEGDYCNLEGTTLIGTGNISIEPHLLMNDWLYAYDDSPDIDAGDPDPVYSDIENPAVPGSANWPAFDGLRNDIGAYGGPGAFPFHPAVFYPDPAVGFVPLNVSFNAYSAPVISDWRWDFGDGDSALVQNPTHLFEIPGRHDVILKAVAASGDTSTFTQPIYALADTIRTDDIEVGISDSDQVEVMVSLTNNVPVKKIILPVEYSGSLDLEYVSYHTTGCRTESYSGIELTPDVVSKTLTFDIKSQLQEPEYLPPGSGPILAIVFRVADWTAGATTIALDGFDPTYPGLTGDGFEYTPEVVSGTVTISYLCGNANGDGDISVADAVFIINFVFKGGPAPEPIESGDADFDGSTNLADAVYLVNYIFRGGPAPCESAR